MRHMGSRPLVRLRIVPDRNTIEHSAQRTVVGVDVRVLRDPITGDREAVPRLLLYLGVLLLVFGNFALFLQHVAAANKREGFGTVKYMLFVLCGLWQMLTVLSLAKAVYELVNPAKRHFWDKTVHGHDLHTLDEAVGGLRGIDGSAKTPVVAARSTEVSEHEATAETA